MSIIVDEFERHLARRIKTERDMRNWSLADLAERAGISKAMISKIERGEASPTAALLGRLSGAFGLTLSTLMARAEGTTSRLVRAAEQPVWQDPATGFRRISISPAGAGNVDLVRGELPPGTSIAYPASSYAFIQQQIWMLKGTLHFVEGNEIHELHAGDCLQLGAPADCRFENRQRTACIYLVVVARQQ